MISFSSFEELKRALEKEQQAEEKADQVDVQFRDINKRLTLELEKSNHRVQNLEDCINELNEEAEEQKTRRNRDVAQLKQQSKQQFIDSQKQSTELLKKYNE